MDKLEGYGEVKSKSRDVEDLTDRYDIVQTELDSKKQEKKRLEGLINSTDSVSEPIEIQERYGGFNSRIDYLEQKKARLDDRVEYTEINIRLSEPTPFNAGFEPRKTMTDAYKAFFNSINLILVGLGYLMPLGLLSGLLYGSVGILRSFRGSG
jgi:hypothetical protein